MTSIPRTTQLDMATKVAKLCQKTVELDQDDKDEADCNGVACRSVFTRSTPTTNCVGTKDAVDNFLEHLRKGCFSDPLPCQDMCYPFSNKPPKDGGPPRLNSKRGTNKGDQRCGGWQPNGIARSSWHRHPANLAPNPRPLFGPLLQAQCNG